MDYKLNKMTFACEPMVREERPDGLGAIFTSADGKLRAIQNEDELQLEVKGQLPRSLVIDEGHFDVNLPANILANNTIAPKFFPVNKRGRSSAGYACKIISLDAESLPAFLSKLRAAPDDTVQFKAYSIWAEQLDAVDRWKGPLAATSNYQELAELFLANPRWPVTLSRRVKTFLKTTDKKFAGGLIQEGLTFLAMDKLSPEFITRIKDLFSTAHKFDPESPASFLGLAELHRKLGKTKQETVALLAAVKRGAKDVNTYKLLAANYEKRRKVTSAIKYLKLAVAADPKDASLHEEVGRLYKKAGKSGMALKAYKQAASLGSENFVTYTAIGDMTARSDPPTAIYAYTRALDLKPDRPKPHLALAKLFTKARAWKEKVRILTAYEVHHRNDPKVTYDLATALLNAGELERAADAFEAAYELSGKKNRQAIATYKKVRQCIVLKNQGKAAYYEDNMQTALKHFKAALDILPSVGRIHLAVGTVRLELNYNKKARASLRDAARLDPGNSKIWKNLGGAFKKDLYWEQAAESYATSVLLDPSQYSLLNELGDIHRRRLRNDTPAEQAYQLASIAAKNAYEKASGINKRVARSGMIHALYYRGLVAHKLNKPDIADESYTELMKLDVKKATALKSIFNDS